MAALDWSALVVLHLSSSCCTAVLLFISVLSWLDIHFTLEKGEALGLRPPMKTSGRRECIRPLLEMMDFWAKIFEDVRRTKITPI
jgi:hypothetical protein